MGFSLVGNSGDQSTTSNIFETSYSASLNPQQDQQGSGAGAFAVNISPLYQGSSGGEIDPDITDYYAPLNITSTGTALGDSALAFLAGITQTQTSASEGTPNPAAALTTSPLSTLFSGDTIYFVLGAIVLLFLAHPKG